MLFCFLSPMFPSTIDDSKAIVYSIRRLPGTSSFESWEKSKNLNALGKLRLREARLRGLLHLGQLARGHVPLPDHPQCVRVNRRVQPHIKEEEQNAIQRVGDHSAKESSLRARCRPARTEDQHDDKQP